jgi:hypothetical protein
VTNFNAGTGATYSSTLAEKADPGAKPGKIPALNKITGSVSCNGQLPGSGTITITGPSAEGTFSQPLTSLRVTCTTPTGYPEFAVLIGVGMAGTTPVVVEIGGGLAAGNNTTPFFMAEDVSQTVSHFYSNKVKAISVANNLVTVSGSVVETVTGSAVAHTLMISGQATCGSSVQV